MKKSSAPAAQRPDLILLVMVLGLLVFGAIMVYDASIVSAIRDFNDKYYYVKDQLKWVVVGLVGLFVTMRLDYHYYRRFAIPLLIISIVSLSLVFLPIIGVSAYGAHRWLNFRFFIAQPSELTKLFLAIFLSAWLADKHDVSSVKRGLIPLLLITGLIGFLVLMEPDLGTFIIIAIMAATLYFAAGARYIFYAIGIPVTLIGGLVFILSSTYRRARLMTFIDPTSDTQGQSYHINQILLSLGSGGIFGTGIGQGRGKYEYIPEVTTDSIFAVIGEELGYLGGLLLISFFGVLLWRCFRIVQFAPDRFGMLLALGITTIIAVQVSFNLASMVSLVPLTGIPLPFISYGGSSLVVILTGVGILLNISKQKIQTVPKASARSPRT